MRVELSSPFIALLLLTKAEGRSWRATPSSPLFPFVVSKDLTSSARSLSSMASSVVSTGESKKSRPQDTDSETANFVAPDLSDDLARGGHSTMAAPSQKENATDEETVTTSDAVETSLQKNETVVHIDTQVTKPEDEPVRESRLSKRARRKKKKLDTSAAVYAKKLKNRNTLNIRRKVMHANFGIFFAALNHFIPRNRFVPGMVVLTSATLVMELLRYKKGFGWMNDALHFVLGSSLRKHEMEGKFTGSFYFFLGVTVTSALYPTTCATMGICQLALADPSASYFGRQTRHVYWSRIEGGLGGFGRNKGVLGFLGGALFCFPFNYRVLSLAQFGPGGIPGGNQALIKASLALGLAGAFADLAVPTPALTMPKRVCGVRVPPFHVDDNFVVPIVSGYACTQVFKALGWPQDLHLSKFILV